jgi:hypothetical protein
MHTVADTVARACPDRDGGMNKMATVALVNDKNVIRVTPLTS